MYNDFNFYLHFPGLSLRAVGSSVHKQASGLRFWIKVLEESSGIPGTAHKGTIILMEN